MAQTIDILSSTPRRLKKEIENILSSYSNQWDILSELLQNSVDSIRRWNKENLSIQKEHRIIINVDSTKRALSVEDSGTGFDPETITDLLAPHGTDKEQLSEEVGEKGVGLTYTMFSCNLFRLETTSVKGFSNATYEGGMSWLKITSKLQQPLLSIDTETSYHNPLDTFSKISLEDVDNLNGDLELFDWNINQLTHILRTKTAVGNFKKLYGEEPLDIKVLLHLTSNDGNLEEREIPFLYQAPTEFVESDRIFDINKRAIEIVGLSPAELKQRLSEKVLKYEHVYESPSRSLHYIAYYVPGGERFWKQVAKDTFDTDLHEPNSFNLLTTPGVYVFVKGMPTGIVIDSPSTGSGGYWNGLFVLINADYLQFDMGRKSLGGNRTKGLFQEAAKDAFTELSKKYLPYVSKEDAGTPAIPEGFTKKKKEILDRLNKLPDLELPGISYIKYPDNQEAAVAAIFHEMVGAGIIKGYCGLGWSYAAQYDMVAKYRGPIEDLVGKKILKSAIEAYGNTLDEDLIIEFKYKAESVLKDISKDTKRLQDINIIVCWEVDVTKFYDEYVIVKPIKPDDAFYHSTNYSIKFPILSGLGEGNTDKYIIALKDIIIDNQRGNLQ